MRIELKYGFPSKNTFSISQFRERILEYMTDGVWLDIFARSMPLKPYIPQSVDYVSNDLNTEFDTDYHLDFREFVDLMSEKYSDITGVLYDPPFSNTMIKKHYDNLKFDWKGHNFYYFMTRTVQKLQPKYMIVFGWHCDIIKDYELVDVLILRHGDYRHSTFMAVHKRRYAQLEMFL